MTELEEQNREEEEEATPIHGDVLELILSNVPLIDLVFVCRVSKTWRRLVFSSLTNFNKIKPWLFLHIQTTRSLEAKETRAYDPRSNIWVNLNQPVIKHVSTLRSSGSNFIYVLSSSGLYFSNDPFHLNWRQIDGPCVCRNNPIVALCGKHIVVSGSGWQFEDDPLAVEVYDPDLSTWRRCQSMPDILKDSAAATWLSVATNHTEMFVTEKASGITYSFDPVAGAWRGPYDLRPDPRSFFSAIGFVGGDLIVASLIGHAGHPESLQLWKMNRQTMACESICEAPREILDKLKGEKATLRQIELSPADNFFYMYDPWEPAELVFCEFSGATGDCVWGSVRNVAWNDDVKIGGNMVLTCGRIEIGDLQSATRSENRKFLINY